MLTCLWYEIISSVCACLPEINCLANSLYWQHPTTQILVRIPKINILDSFYKGNLKQHQFLCSSTATCEASRSNRTKYIHMQCCSLSFQWSKAQTLDLNVRPCEYFFEWLTNFFRITPLWFLVVADRKFWCLSNTEEAVEEFWMRFYLNP